MDLERLDEAIRWYESKKPWNVRGDTTSGRDCIESLLDAARAYRDLANGERVEPDYEAAWDVWVSQPSLDDLDDDEALAHLVEIVDAAIAGRLLVDPPTEED